MSSVHTRPSTKASSVVLYRRLLFPNLPSSASPPPLLRDGSPELNTELYDFIALALRAHITPWWSKVTRYDRELIPQVAVVLGSVVREVETRLRAADMAQLVFCTIPTLVGQHYVDYRAASAKVGTGYASGGAATAAQLFHQYQGHMGIDADGQIDGTYIRHTVDLILQACLPSEDRESEAERAIIREVVAKVVVKDVIPLVCQPWFIHKVLLDQLRTWAEKTGGEAVGAARAEGTLHSGVVFVLSAVQYLSGLCLTLIHWYKQVVHSVKVVNARPRPGPGPQGFAASLLHCASEVLDTRQRAAASAVFDLAGSVLSFLDGFTDRLLLYLLERHVLTEERVLRTVKTSKQLLYPNGYPGPPSVVPSPEEQALLSLRLVNEIEARSPSVVRSLLLGAGPSVEAALEPVSASYACNAHLLLFILDAIVAALFPELCAGFSTAVGDRNGCPSGEEDDSADSSDSATRAGPVGTPETQDACYGR